jgi:hypothetical protein
LLDAQALTHDETSRPRIADDLRRVEMLGQPVALGFKPSGNRRVDNIAEFHGKAVLLVFFAAWSEPSMDAVVELQRSIAALPKDRVQLLGVSLDTKPEKLGDFARTGRNYVAVWCDGKELGKPMIRPSELTRCRLLGSSTGRGGCARLNALEDTCPRKCGSWSGNNRLGENSTFQPMKPRDMKIGLWANPDRNGPQRANIAAILAMIGEAAAQGCDVLALPSAAWQAGFARGGNGCRAHPGRLSRANCVAWRVSMHGHRARPRGTLGRPGF